MTIQVCFEDGHPSDAVRRGVAEARGVAPADIGPLDDYVDAEALDALFDDGIDPHEQELMLSFLVEDLQVIVLGDGRILVRNGSDAGARDFDI